MSLYSLTMISAPHYRNLDSYTETYGFSFYLHYLVNWPEYFQIAEHGPTGRLMGYSEYPLENATYTSNIISLAFQLWARRREETSSGMGM